MRGGGGEQAAFFEEAPEGFEVVEVVGEFLEGEGFVGLVAAGFVVEADGGEVGDDAPFGFGEAVEVIEELLDGGAAVGFVGVEIGAGVLEFDDGGGVGGQFIGGEGAQRAIDGADVGDVKLAIEMESRRGRSVRRVRNGVRCRRCR